MQSSCSFELKAYSFERFKYEVYGVEVRVPDEEEFLSAGQLLRNPSRP